MGHYFQHLANFDIDRIDGRFNHLISTAQAKQDSPWPHLSSHTNDHPLTIEHHDIDRESHKTGMQRFARPKQ
jgi:hypothetical protein